MSESHLGRRPIGVFDSGLGGLTVVHELRRQLPFENIVYLGDNARVPYGTRSAETISRYARNCAAFLMSKGLKMLVIACNTASAVAVDELARLYDVPVLGVIEAGAISALEATHTGRIGVIGTAGTIGSNAYPRALSRLQSRLHEEVVVFQNAAPLLVPLVEEGWIEGTVPRLALERYLTPLVTRQVDVLLLGCTHYPVLKDEIRAQLDAMGSRAQIRDSAQAMARRVTEVLQETHLARFENDGVMAPGRLACYVTDLPADFARLATCFLKEPILEVEKIDIQDQVMAQEVD